MQKQGVIAGLRRAIPIVVGGMVLASSGFACAREGGTAIPSATVAATSAAPASHQTPISAPDVNAGQPTDASQPAVEVVFFEEPDFDKALGMIEAGEAHLYASGTSDPAREQRIQNSPVMAHDISYGSYTDLTFNPVGPTFPGTGELNPFSVPAIREAMNRLVDRDHIVEEIYGGLAVPRYLPLNTTFPDYARLADVARVLEISYRHDAERSKIGITTEMEKLGATLEGGRWHFQGKPVRLAFIIRTEDARREIGDYVATLLEELGFAVDRQYKTAAEASPIWATGIPSEGKWHLYTGAWISTAISRDQADNFSYFYTSRGLPDPLWQAYEPAPEFDQVAELLSGREYPTWEERQQLMARAVELALKDSVRVWLVDTISVWPRRNGVNLAADLAGGVSGSWLWPYTLEITTPEISDRVVRFATPSILTEPWNPVAGSTSIYDLMIMGATTDSAALPDPLTGLSWPQRVERAEVYVEEGTPVTRTLDWLTLSFVPSIEVPPDAWIDWDAAEQRIVTVGQQHPEGLTARTRTVVYYKDDLYALEWHDGSKMSLGDMVVGFVLALDRAKPASAIYDEAEVPSLETFFGHFRGLRILQEDPLVVEVYSNHISPDAETIAGSRAGYLFTSTPWPSLALGILAEQNHELAFSSSKADQLKVEWMSYIAGPTLPILDRYLVQAQEDGYIPYENTAGQYISTAEAQDRYRRLREFHQARGHFWVGQGPFYLSSVYPTEKNVVIRRFDRFPDPADKWQRFIDPRIPEVDISGPVRITSGEPAQFQVKVTFQGDPYAADDIELARFLVLDARSELVASANIQPRPDGLWIVELTPEQTAELETGSTRLEVAVVSRLVSIPSFETFSFVTIGP